MRQFFKAALVAAAISGVSGAYALTDTNNLQVSLTITAACDVTTTAPSSVAFGSHAQTASTPVDNTGAVTVTCQGSTPYNVLLGQGGNYSSGRRLVASGNYVPYELYRDSSHTQVWGQTIGTDTQTGTGTNTFTVYGRVPSLSFPAGNYTDTVLVTVDY
ncbi:spore coat protein U domain-containing protein [Ramlibacter sp. G-1-2-2]|uniref:Spore coat protein U domain-containing protein n=1 Tax=Ramlibacter agri TaxID=2728837 RepID=A0A848H2N5_9BURK|nr:spore coat U domain-containing protein [Ramlibacter agri]NML42963.1 spore coat protein U domain-containing protein [Ramlibacter agri]